MTNDQTRMTKECPRTNVQVGNRPPRALWSFWFGRSSFRRLTVFGFAALLCGGTGCWEDQMADQPKAQPYSVSGVFSDGTSDRPLPPGVVTRGGVAAKPEAARVGLFAVSLPDPALDQADFPRPMTAADLERGHQQFNNFCVMCHGQTGAGDGIVVRRGFPRPPSYYERRLRDAAPGHVVNVIAHGKGAMYPYYARVEEADRWRIAAYVRALQLSTDRVDPPREATPMLDRPKAEVTQ